MGWRFAVYLSFAAVITVAGLLTFGAEAQEAELPKPDAPLAMAAGESVSLAWSLPAKPKPELVVIYRGTKDGAQFVEVGRVAADVLRFTDKEVSLGRSYQYRVQTVKGARVSALSEPAEVLVGGSARITFLGGSLERALFEVVMFRRGRRITAQFVHKPGDAIGDLAWVSELDSVEDFRLGPKLQALAIGIAEARESVSQPLIGADGQPVTDIAGRTVQVEFRLPGATHEIMIATLLNGEGQPVQIKEGESFTAD
ncbi:MAG: fibronectin type III domain-containing protein [Planctomycetes bacterium]|nr:fibronectin type III domain-containing protein [Planctomycetota bacterium]MCB9935944.1 fibronectin type III domain-containing protein [Planctomycetota bacterium]